MSNQLMQQESTIRTFAIMDVEINDFIQHQFNNCALTELCIYGISVKCLKNDIIKNGREVNKVPKLPRVRNRLNLMINPLRRIHDDTKTGLDNYMLENETSFEEDTAECILKFINRLEKPVCLVAHNGLDHDFRIIRHVFEKIHKEFPPKIFCVDSLDAFRKIDRVIDDFSRLYNKQSGRETEIPNAIEEETSICSKNVSNEIMWQTINETTPNKKISSINIIATKESNRIEKRSHTLSKVKRKLNFGDEKNRGYRLHTLYKSVFKKPYMKNRHHAEYDVMHLTELCIHYGLEFVKYAESNKQTFDQVKKLGAKNVLSSKSL